MKPIVLILLANLLTFYVFGAVPTVTSFAPASAASGMSVVITGTNFTGATSVTFGGSAASSFVVNSATQITAVVGTGTTGIVQVTNTDGPGSKSGFTYIATSGIFTDFGGFWSGTGAAPNAVIPDNSYNLLAFTHNGVTYSTGVNNSILTANSVTFSAGSFKALPVAGLTGTTGATSTYLALAKKVDGSANVANTPAVASYSIRSVLVDGPNGLNMGTGVTNLPTTAILTFQIFNIDGTKTSDTEPDIILTQIAQPVTGNDVFSFIDASGITVGNTVTQDMTLLPKFGSYDLDLFNLTPSTPYNSARAYSAFSTSTNREIRMIAFRLADFGINAGNVSQVKALKITPSGTSDYAFIAYNANAINLPPNVTQNDDETNSSICAGGTANLSVLATAVSGGALSYSWEQSTNGGTVWTSVTNGGSFSGATTNRLSIAGATNAYKYRVIVTEAGNGNPATSTVFTINVGTPTAPSSVTVSSTASTCLNTPVQLTSSVTGGSNINYQWQTNASGSYVDITNATLSTYVPPVDQTGVISYRLRASSGSGCAGAVTSATPATITVTGISATTPASRCATGTVSLSASATSGTVDWYDADASGTLVASATSTFTTPSLAATKTYYVVNSGCPSALRVPVTATVYPTTAGGSIAGSTTVTAGANSTTLTLSGQVGTILQWQSSTDAFNTVINNIANTTNQLTATNLSQTTQYRASVQSGTCTGAFSSTATITVTGSLPIDDKSLQALRKNNVIELSWAASEQQNTLRYEIEKSVDGLHFNAAGTNYPVDINSSSVNYKWVDSLPADGYNYYRIREIYLSGDFKYSAIVKTFFEPLQSEIRIFPNPVSGRTFNLQLSNIETGNYKVSITNSVGQLLKAVQLRYRGTRMTEKISLPGDLPEGIYWITIEGHSIKKKTIKILLR